MRTIQEVIQNSQVNELRLRRDENQKEMLSIKSTMSKLTFHLPVAKYAYCLDYQKYYESKKELTPKENKHYLECMMQMGVLESDPNVQTYIDLHAEYERLQEECEEYYQAVNVTLREGFRGMQIPDIFVYQGILDAEQNLKVSRHIIANGVHEIYIDTPSLVIHPMGGISSKREARHFYNHVSFHYLEQLCQDGSYDPKVKKLGKIYMVQNGKIVE